VNKSVSIVVLYFLILSGISSCSKDPGSVPDMGFNYFPDKVGTYVVYNVDSIVYNRNNMNYPAVIDTFKFQIKEKIESIYTDNEGRPTMRLERYVKYFNDTIPYSNMNWILRDIWAQNKNLRTAEKVEENIRFIKLLFPVKEGQEWNGNSQNTNGEENYKYAFFDQRRTIGNILFDSVLQVTQQDESSLVRKIYYEEKYARNVGLIYKRVIDVDSQYNPLWNQPPILPYLSDSLSIFYPKDILIRASSGFHYTMTVISYGTE
jgi:hypothetical protein